MDDDIGSPRADSNAVTILEGRRLAVDVAMWQAPTLVLIAQAFLLLVLTDRAVDFTVRLFVALAGIAALVVVGISLWQQRDRETAYRRYIDGVAGVPDVPPTECGPKAPEVRTWALWTIVVFPLFGAADVLALVLMH
jgi:hypothetical protein